ncbi:RrF2 family transcriptional regulator [Desulfovirgula thermocuniculi]|uniref:RrF2 family transcriptional regulator n=1 Tax=Desulfovirgula thermocuniculi TaxID=348842 RepID=UPI000428E9E8|nr:Rrf2 family transcriptional regulator [Desulfovirgula thermocuniculi]
MRLSTRGHYGLKAIMDLALRYGQGPVALRSVAERQGISEHYLEQLIALLRQAGLVKGVRGAQGGYMLAREPEKIKVGEVIRALEGPIAPVSCVKEGDPVACDRVTYCRARTVWLRVRDAVASTLDSISLADLCREAEDVRKGGHNAT